MNQSKRTLPLPEHLEQVYRERNLLVLYLATVLNDREPGSCGYYLHPEAVGFSRVISLDHGAMTFHVPDDFDLDLDLGALPEIPPNWDGHTTSEKFELIRNRCGL